MVNGSPAGTAPSGTPLTPGTRDGTPAAGSAVTPEERTRETSESTRPDEGGGRASAAPAAVSRRSHPKSRSGCRTCKKRKIKCDEHKPQCRNCIKHAVPCDFLQSHPVSSPSELSPNSAALAGLGGNGSGQSSAGDLNMVDLELIHNFTTFTHATLSSDPAVRQMMRTSVVRMALSCDYIMRTLLAVSALHLAHYRADKREFYVSRALQHHQIASQAAIPSMSDLSYENCENLHLFSILTLYFALGCPKRDDDSLVIGESVFPHWLFLLRGVEPVIRVLDPHNYNGPLKAIFTHGRERWSIIHDSDAPTNPTLLADLQASVNKACTDPALLDIYNRMILHLRRALSMLFPAVDEDERMSGVPSASSGGVQTLEAWDIFIWKWSAAGDFLPLLQGPEARQEAVAIFAHFLIMLKKLESQWWLEGWATHLIEKAWSMLDQEHRLWIQWPIEELGWVPP